MPRKILLPTIFIVLAYGFRASPDFKEIAAGVAIFLFGMLSLEQGFKAFTGGVLEKLLRKTTSSLWKSLGFGIVSTTIMQSSSLVSVITISFLSAGLITLTAGIGIIFGANIGTTTGAWLVAGFGLKVKISAYAMPMLVFGIILIFQKSKALSGIGYILAGLGFLFLGIHHMKVGFEAFKASIDLSQFAVTGYSGLFIFTGIGIFATVVMQSSHATLVLIITALAAQQISYENALALAIGANIGTTITAILGAMSANAQGKRLAGAHLIFNMTTGLIAIIFIYQLVEVVNNLSVYLGIRDDDYTLKLAVFHTVFNLIGILVMIPFINPLVKLLKRVLKEKKSVVDKPKYLTESAIDFPDTAAEAVLNETKHVYENALSIIVHGLGFKRSNVFSDENIEEIATSQKKITRLDIDSAYERSIKGIYSAIIQFISRASFSWEMEQSGELHHLRQANQYIVEAVKDVKHLQKNLMQYLLSNSDAMHEAYNKLRVQLAGILRELEEIRTSDPPDTDILSLDALQLVVEDSQNELNLWLTELILSGRITPEMGTSLMNDSAYARDVSNNLISAARTLFVATNRELTQAERSVSLDEKEIEQAAAE
ncbi:Na/Pi cotransporter family protein [Solemya velesiana gill symbiont]|uniref:Sodium:phosphate symporter n=1 Tax=Solemya velesiana gill symbiont TaxID=1918948 RepID=A0A1T2KSX1_9GAMM|nr:Na/Pi symporter [Solemya velesiana gill symbiont]OOZ35912.1 sodium:phosphate symporter [Solemya velesiana gill symbiont]